MSVNKPRTIDDLGLDASIQYALAQKESAATHIIADSSLAQQPEVLVTSPTLPPYELAFGIRVKIAWAILPKPPIRPVTILFTFQLIPSLGPPDKQQELLDAFTAKGANLPQDPLVQEAYKKILALLQTLESLQRTHQLIEDNRNRYKKG